MCSDNKNKNGPSPSLEVSSPAWEAAVLPEALREPGSVYLVSPPPPVTGCVDEVGSPAASLVPQEVEGAR